MCIGIITSGNMTVPNTGGECTTANCPGLTAEQVAKTTHDYTDATDPYCDTCGYVRSMYSVITGENVTAELEDKVLNVPVAADTKVHLTATVPEESASPAGR